MSQESQIWEKQPYDSNTGYGCFVKYYLNVPDGERSYIKAYNAYLAERNRPPKEILPGNWHLWCYGRGRDGRKSPGRHTWAERYEAFQAHVDEENRKALHRKILDDAQDWANMQEGALRRERDYADKLYKVADSMLSFPLFNRRTKVTPEGQTQIIVEPAGWKFADVVSLLRLASDMNRRGLLMPRDGALQEDTWRQTLLQMDLDPDDPESWMDFLSSQPDTTGEDASREAQGTPG